MKKYMLIGLVSACAYASINGSAFARKSFDDDSFERGGRMMYISYHAPTENAPAQVAQPSIEPSEMSLSSDTVMQEALNEGAPVFPVRSSQRTPIATASLSITPANGALTSSSFNLQKASNDPILPASIDTIVNQAAAAENSHEALSANDELQGAPFQESRGERTVI